MHENAQNTRKVFDFKNYYQKRQKIVVIYIYIVQISKNFNELGGHFRRSLMSKLQNFLPLRPNHGGPSRVTTFIRNFKKLDPYFSKLDYSPEEQLFRIKIKYRHFEQNILRMYT